MPNSHFPDVLRQMAERGIISRNDVLKLRQNVFSDGVVSQDEAEMLFRVDQICDQQDASWSLFFIEALTDYCVYQAQPRGYVSPENADWLMSQIDRDGTVKTETELELLITILDKAQSSPENLSAYALAQVKQAVLYGKGVVRRGLGLRFGVVGEADVDILRRVLYAFGGDGNIAITRSEAEVLFDINDCTSETENHVLWSELFVKAIGNFMMAASGYTPPSREVVLRQESWLEERDGAAGLMAKMLSAGLQGALEIYARTDESVQEQRVDALEQDVAVSEQITGDEAEWLSNRIGRDGIVHENEQALIEFIKQNSPKIHPSLKALIARAA